MNNSPKLAVRDVNSHLTCFLCGGYYIDATTIIECLHSFCRSCIVRYLESSKFCPVCEVQVHKTKPLLNIRPDHTLQTLVYKIVPGLYQKEMCLRREFYAKHSSLPPLNPEDRGEVTDRFIYSSDEPIELLLEYFSNESSIPKDEPSRRFLRCPAAVSIGLLKRLYRAKFGLDPEHPMDMYYEDKPLRDEFTLVDVAYIYQWRRKGPMKLRYQIYEIASPNVPEPEQTQLTATEPGETPPKKLKLDDGEPLKEVQLEISETGIVSVLHVDTPDSMATVVSCGRSSAEVSDSSQQREAKNSVESLPLLDESPMVSPSNPEALLPAPPAKQPGTNGITSPPPLTSKKPANTAGYKTLKHPPKLWNPSVAVTVKKVSATVVPVSTVARVTSSPQTTTSVAASPTTKPPRFFKARNAANRTATGEVKNKPSAVSSRTITKQAASPANSSCPVRESPVQPVQEVAVNLSKSSPQSRMLPSSESVRVPSPAQHIAARSATPPAPRPSSAPAQLKSQPQSPLSVEDPTLKLRHILVPSSSSSGTVGPTCVTLAPPAISENSALRFSTWLPVPRSPRSATPYVRPMSSFHLPPPFPFLPSVSLSALNYAQSEVKKSSSVTGVVSATPSTRVTSAIPGHLPSPTFALNALQPFGGVLPAIPNINQDLTGPRFTGFQHSSQGPRLPRSPATQTLKSPGASYHHPLPPTVTNNTQSRSGVAESKETSLSKAVARPAVPRRTVAPPPPLVPIAGSTKPVNPQATPANRTKAAEEKDCKVVESSVNQLKETNNVPEPGGEALKINSEAPSTTDEEKSEAKQPEDSNKTLEETKPSRAESSENCSGEVKSLNVAAAKKSSEENAEVRGDATTDSSRIDQ